MDAEYYIDSGIWSGVNYCKACVVCFRWITITDQWRHGLHIEATWISVGTWSPVCHKATVNILGTLLLCHHHHHHFNCCRSSVCLSCSGSLFFCICCCVAVCLVLEVHVWRTLAHSVIGCIVKRWSVNWYRSVVYSKFALRSYHNSAVCTARKLQCCFIYASAAARGCGCVYVLQRFFFVFFPIRHDSAQIWNNRSRERLNGFPWNFYQTIVGKMEFPSPLS